LRATSQRVLRVLATVPFLFASISGPAIADDSLDKRVSAAADALAKASAIAAQAAKDLKAAQSQLPAARKALEVATAAEATARSEYKVARANADTAKAIYTEALIRVTSKQAEISILQKKVDQFARSVYQQGQTTQWGIILNSTSPTDLTLRLEAIRVITQANAQSLDELVIAKEQLAVEANDAENKHEEAKELEGIAADSLARADAAADKAAKAKAAVDALVAQEAAAFKLADDDRARVKRQYDELRAEQLRVSGISRTVSKGTGDPQATGPLSWPLPGRSAGGGVGWRVHPVYKYRSCHTGIDISAPTGTPILSAGSGRVISARWSTAYGNMMLIDHGGGLVSMYAHMTAFAVGNGAGVGLGQTIGYVGSTGWSTGPHLHFEVHVNGVPHNPMGWFGASRTPVSCWG
jgi:murein DD-endopeptidase MepM/ murein hydrolase activator NlpD